MTFNDRTVTTLTLDNSEALALSMAQNLLDTIEDYLFGYDYDAIVNTDTGEVVKRSDLTTARNLLDTFENCGCPTNWKHSI